MEVRHRPREDAAQRPLEFDEASIFEGVSQARKEEDLRFNAGNSFSCAVVSVLLGVLLLGAAGVLLLGSPSAAPARRFQTAQRDAASVEPGPSQDLAEPAEMSDGLRAVAPSSTTAPPARDVAALAAEVQRLTAWVRQVKRGLVPGTYMETDPVGRNATAELQRATRELLAARYGEGPLFVDMLLEFPDSMPGDKTSHVIIELAPLALMPHAVHTFLMAVVEDFKGAAFHRRAPHVLQAMVSGGKAGLAFQEYSAAYPHVLGTLGYAGRPGGPGFYISTVDNTRNHGPGSQNANNPFEADSCFGRVARGLDDVVMQRMRTQPGADGGAGWVNDAANHIKIKSAKLTTL